MNGERYATTATYSVPTISEWYIGADSFDLTRQWHGQVYLAAVLHGSMTWGEMEAWGRAPFEFLWPLVKRRSSYLASGGGGGGGTANNLLLLGVG
ncbi:MAG: hypothetical protein EKK55_12540 [Rhodocyclaceae bacterium]|nr:MAG: hypothetical protein EKK55_12540 [Rhodocyclaceae bacterium]